jgi:hypothetical protein
MSVNEARSQRLQQARIASGFKSAADAARRFGWKYPTYAMHEGGAGLGKFAPVYAKAFRVSQAWLLTGEGGNISPVAEKLLSDFQALTPEDQQRVLDHAAVLRLAAGMPAQDAPVPPKPPKGGPQ